MSLRAVSRWTDRRVGSFCNPVKVVLGANRQLALTGLFGGMPH